MPLTAVRRRLSDTVRAAGKRFGFDAAFFAKNSAIATFTYVASVCSGLVTGYLVARMLPADVYGGYKFVLGITGMISVISIPGLGSAISRDIATKKPGDVALRFTLLQNALICLIGALALLGCILLLPLWHREELWPLFVVSALVFIPNQVGATFFSGIVTGTGSFGRSLKVTALSSVCVILTVLPMLLLYPSPAILLGLVVGIPSLFYLREIKRDLAVYRSESRSWGILQYGTQLSLNTIPITLSDYLDGILVSAFFGLKTLAVFSVAIIIPDQIKAWSKSLLPISFARQAAGNDDPERRRKMTVVVLLATAIFGAGILVYVLVCPWILWFLFPSYRADLSQLILLSRLAALILISVPATLFPQFLEARGRVRELRRAQWSSAVILCVMLLLLVPPYGAVGALIARGIFRLSYVFSAYLSIRALPYSPRKS
jgi:O-antigen/teichoic acid export membrane protein